MNKKIELKQTQEKLKMPPLHAPYEHFSDFYDEYYQEDFYHRYFKFIENATGIKLSKNISVLDVACGTGRLLSYFKSLGCTVYGIDCSTAMAACAKDRDIPVSVADMRSYKLDRKFDLILCTFDSLNYLSEIKDLSQTFKVIADHLKHSGWFVFDMITPYKIDVIIPSFGTTYEHLEKRDLIWLNDHKPGIWYNTLISFVKENNGYQRFEERHCSHAFSFSEISDALLEAGFKKHAVYSSQKMEVVNEKSGRWHFVCSF